MYLIFEVLIRKKQTFSLTEEVTKFRYSSRKLKINMGKLVSRYLGYWLILAYDDWMDEREISQSEAYEHLLRCSLGILIGLNPKLSLTLDNLDIEFAHIRNKVKTAFKNNEYAF